MTYCELHGKSAFSFLQGACLPEEYADAAARFSMPAMALLDRDGVYGSPRFYLGMKKAGPRALTGAEVLCSDGCRYPLLVRDRAGYQNLCRMLTRAKLRTTKDKPTIVQPGELAEFAQGLICLTGDENGPLAKALREERGGACLNQLSTIFGKGNVFVELQRHFQRSQEVRNQAAISLARSAKLPLIATNGPAYVQPAQRQILDVFTCLHHKETLASAGQLLQRNSERHLKSPEEMIQLFRDLPEAIDNTIAVSEQLQFEMTDLGVRVPEIPSATRANRQRVSPGENARRSAETVWVRVQVRSVSQLERELNVIGKLKLDGYFLIVWDIVNFCRAEGILVQGRGSAANSAVCYALGITSVDPIAMGCSSKDFFREERGEMARHRSGSRPPGSDASESSSMSINGTASEGPR